MKLETNMSKIKGFSSPLTKEGMRALVIVLGVILVISAVIYSANLDKRRESTVLPSKTLTKVTARPQPATPTETPTVAPLIEEATSSASPTPAVEGVTVTPAPTR